MSENQIDIFDGNNQPVEPCRSIVDFTESLDQTNMVKNENCKLCNSEYRAEAEEMFGRTNNYTQVLAFLQKNGEDISMSSVRRHFKKHFMKPVLNATLADYASDLQRWAKYQQTTEERFITHLTVIERQIHLINANTDESNPDSLRKGTDAVVKLMEQAGKIEERLKKHRERFEPIEIFTDRFRAVVMSRLDSIESPEAREALVEIIDAVEKEAEAIING